MKNWKYSAELKAGALGQVATRLDGESRAVHKSIPVGALHWVVLFMSLAIVQSAMADVCDSDPAEVLKTQNITEKRVMKSRSLSLETIERRGLDSESGRSAKDLQVAQFMSRPDTEGLIYFIRDGQYCLMHIYSNGSKDFRLLGDKSKVESDVAGFQFALDNLASSQDRKPRRRNASAVPPAVPTAVSSLSSVTQSATILSDLLLPVRWNDRKTMPAKLIVLPVGALGSVPFALLKPKGGSTPLIESATITVLPSVSAQTLQHRVWTGLSEIGTALIVGNPAFGHDPDFEFPTLPGAEVEARAVGKLFRSANVLMGVNASLEGVRTSYAQSDYLYFATHGIADALRPLDGGFLALSDGRLTAREIQNAHLNARLAVLSACQTGLGGSSDAGTLGLARAFYLSGVDSIVMSLWNVDDEATAFLMTHFMKNAARQEPAEALRNAILSAKKRYPNEPHKWASFAYFGVAF